MAIPIRTAKEIEGIRAAGALTTGIIRQLSGLCRPGVTTASLARAAESIMLDRGAEPVMRDQTNAAGERFPFAASICVNEEVGIGLPGPRRIRPGDVVGIDVALRYGGWCADAASTVVVPGETARSPSELVGPARCHAVASIHPTAGLPSLDFIAQSVRGIFRRAIERLRPGLAWPQVVSAIARDAGQAGLTLLPDFGAHGVGTDLHESPELTPATDLVLRPGMVLAVEPVFVTGSPDLVDLLDGWGAATADRGVAFHEERTIALTRAGPVVLAGPL